MVDVFSSCANRAEFIEKYGQGRVPGHENTEGTHRCEDLQHKKKKIRKKKKRT